MAGVSAGGGAPSAGMSGFGGISSGGAAEMAGLAGSDEVGGASGEADGGAEDGANSGGGGSSASSDVAGEGGEGGGAGAPDTTPPVIVSVTPVDGATAVRANTDIVITFSEPMDESETAHAFQSDDLRPGDIDLSWGRSGRVLTVHPIMGLDYQSASDPAPREYSYWITTLARDLAGNHLIQERTFSFTTLARYTQTLTPVDVRELVQNGTTKSECTDATTSLIAVGDTADNDALGALLTFSLGDLQSMPEAGDLVSAALAETTPGSYPAAISVFHVAVDPALATWSTELLNDIGTLTGGTHGLMDATPDSLDVSSAVDDDLKNTDARAGRTQYVLRWANGSNLDDSAQESDIQCQSVGLSVTYFAP
ncbi:MAG TPA: Ig-like domain-containing protein [Polyangiaceae bacterium]|nr:Ig-like domain-containing protein [Polyangiaceae bacterium]